MRRRVGPSLRLGSSTATFVAVLLALAGPARAVEVRAQLAQEQLTVGETTALEVIVEGAGGNVADPRFDLPQGVEVLGSSRSQNFSWINGKTSNRLVFRYELAATAPGSYRIGPIQVTVNGQAYLSPAVALTVGAERARVSGTGRGVAALLVDVTPRNPYVGEPVVLRVRLVQRASLAEDPRYTPPATPGFWAERNTQPESYYADEAMARVLVTETRARLYPLAAGQAKIGEASAMLAVAQADRMDPLAWLNGIPSRREVEVHSAAISVPVRPLPPGAPAGFDGAVGRLTASWSVERPSAAQDVPFNVRLDLRGVGNLPLVRTPTLTLPEAEVFASTVEDSLGSPGTREPGRRRFTWTVLARRSGPLRLEPPTLAWFDPVAQEYRRASLAPIELEVGPPSVRSSSPASEFPPALATHGLDPFAVPAKPWGLGVAGALVGVALRLLRRRRSAVPVEAESEAGSASASWREGLRHGRGASFWAAAARAADTLAQRGEDVAELRKTIDGARFGNASAPEDALRADLLRRLARPVSRESGTWRARAIAAACIVAAVAIVALSLPHPGPDAGVRAAREADRVARTGDIERAARVWRDLWRRGSRVSGLAARLAWSEIRMGSVAEASAWVLRGDAGEARDPSLHWVTSQIREAGGLAGYAPSRVPLRSWEWGVLAAALAIVAVLLGGRRAVAVAALAVVVSVADDGQRIVAGFRPRAVVRSDVPLEGADLELGAGDVVRVVRRERGRVWVEAGRGVSGWVPAAALAEPRT